MDQFKLVDQSYCIPIVVEAEAYEGVYKIAQKSAQDMELITGKRPVIHREIPKIEKRILLYATIGKSKLVDDLIAEKKICPDQVIGKREVYGIYLVEQPWEGVDQALVIVGNDKRGTIYGIFHLSEEIGVSPLHFWGDAKPLKRASIFVDEKIQMIAKEPSVRYRGFFVNDEWPCFGTWAMNHFNGFTVEMYDHVFELLLRLKGNYLWPAMWTSSIALDGPGDKNVVLADEYGIIIGNSHHEPCLRASEEWDIYKGEDTPYGTQWNYKANKKGLLEYWRDGLKRSGQYESIITVGMRGERDSAVEGATTLEDNILLLKDVIEEQNKLIAQYVNQNEVKAPKLLAVYKEVEKYFYGTKETPGLRNWEGLNDIILMLCEDNFGNMRTLPDEEMRAHPGGLGMYYHLDYHGSPVSYEWINSTPLTKIWEQMTEAYEYGVRDVWIINVGDLKGNEFPLSYFMDLAYDFDTWGTSAMNRTQEYTKKWIRTQFGNEISMDQVEELAGILRECVELCHLRRLEALHSDTYHPAHFGETDRMIQRVLILWNRARAMEHDLKQEYQDRYYSLIYHYLQSGMNLLLMQLYAGKNQYYAKQGKIVANYYNELVKHAIQKDKELAVRFGTFFGGKWKGMELEHHIGFKKWNEDGCQYPLRVTVEPFDRPRLLVSRAEESSVAVKNYGRPEQIEIRDFLYPGCHSVEIEIANDGIGSFICEVQQDDCEWINVSWSQKEIREQEILIISCNEELLTEKEQIHHIYITDWDGTVEIVIYGKKTDLTQVPPMTFLEQNGVVAIHADHFAYQRAVPQGEWRILEDYGKVGIGLKAFPVTQKFGIENSPVAGYYLSVTTEGTYEMEIWSAPSNPLERNGRLRFGLCINQGEVMEIPTVSEDYEAGEAECEEWARGVMDQIHKTYCSIDLKKGLNEIQIYAIDPGFVLEKFMVYQKRPVESYLGTMESLFING